MIAKSVVFVQDEDSNNYYIPKDKLEEWNYHVNLECFVKNGGDVPDYATLVEGEQFVYDIVERL